MSCYLDLLTAVTKLDQVGQNISISEFLWHNKWLLSFIEIDSGWSVEHCAPGGGPAIE